MAEPFPALTHKDPPALGPYRLAGVLGAGGMGKVYLGVTATPRGAPRPVAVKVLLPHLTHDIGLVRRFAREARAARAVHSRRVARVINWHPDELGADDQSSTQPPPAVGTTPPWIATEFLAGPTLAAAIDGHGPFGTARLRALGAELAAALDDISRAGLIHRDLKPANIVLTATGPRVIDFGIARPEHGLTLTTTGQIPATPGYAAPEQLLGRRASPAADIFSLGVVLARAATGRAPFAAADALAVNYRVVYEEPDLNGIPAELRDLIAHCLMKDPADRPTATELRQRLAPPRHPLARLLPPARRAARPPADPFWRGGPVAADIAEQQQRVRSALRRFTSDHGLPATGRPSRRRAMGLALAGGGLALSAAGGLLLWQREPGTTPSDGSPDASPPDGRPTDAEPLSDYVAGIAPDPYWEVADAVDDSLDGPIAMPVAEVVVVPGPDGGITAHSVADGGTVVWREPRADPAAGYLAAGSWQQESGELVLTAIDGGTLLAIAADDGAERWTADTGFSTFTLLAADGTQAFLRGGTGHVAAVNLTGGTVSWTTADPVYPGAEPPDTWRRPAAAAAGGLLLICTDDQVIALDSTDGTELWNHPAEFPSGPLPPAIDPERGVAAIGGASLSLLTLDDGTEEWSRPAQGRDGYSPPALGDDAVYACDRLQLVRHGITDGGAVWTARASAGEDPLNPTEPPVLQAGSVWLVLGGTPPQGVSVWLQNDGTGAWTYTDGQTGTWRVSAAGNRVFLVHQGVLRAMPAP